MLSVAAHPSAGRGRCKWYHAMGLSDTDASVHYVCVQPYEGGGGGGGGDERESACVVCVCVMGGVVCVACTSGSGPNTMHSKNGTQVSVRGSPMQ